MKKWLQRIRGAVGMGLTWAAGWLGVGMILFSGLAVFGTPPIGYGLVAVVVNSFSLAAFGFIGGAAFSTVLGIAERRRRFDQMSLPRFAGWGGVGGLLMSLLVGGGGLPLIVAAFTLLGAGSAAGSLALARRAEDRELLEAGKEALGLTGGV